MVTLQEILVLLKQLSTEDLNTLRTVLLSAEIVPAITLESFTEESRFANDRVCPLCGSAHIVRNGHRKDGVQRYRCRDCNKSFVINSNSITKGTRKPFDIWKKYIECMLNGLSIRKTATVCDIHKTQHLFGDIRYLMPYKICRTL